MFLHKFDILNKNLNGLFQNFLPVVTKLCAVTKLRDLTVPCNTVGAQSIAPAQSIAHSQIGDSISQKN